MDWTTMLEIALLATVAFVQNMAFTWVSRSRNSGDPNYHRYAAWCSNGIWFATNVLIFRQVWAAVDGGEWWHLLAAGLAYVVATSEGSVLMMRILLKTEKGKRRVAAYDDEQKKPGSGSPSVNPNVEQHSSDCALHDAPAYNDPEARCTCGLVRLPAPLEK